MCSDLCPCENDLFTSAGFENLDESILTKYERKNFDIGGSFDKNMLFTRLDADRWVGSLGPSDGFSSLAKKMFLSGGGIIGNNNLNSYLGRQPPTVNSYKTCFDDMLNNQAFGEYVESKGETQKAFWEDFDTKDAWKFFEEVESDFNCAGICYVPMFYLTKDLSAGIP